MTWKFFSFCLIVHQQYLSFIIISKNNFNDAWRELTVYSTTTVDDEKTLETVNYKFVIVAESP